MRDAIRALCAVTDLPGAGQAPDWVQLVPAGLITGRDGRSFRLGDPASGGAASDLGADLPIDDEHQIDDPARRSADGVVKAAGWIKALEVRADGLWGRADWTEAARNRIAAQEDRSLSPVPMHRQAGAEGVRILGASLAQCPNLQLKALSSEDPSRAAPGAAVPQIATVLGLGGAGWTRSLPPCAKGRPPTPRKTCPSPKSPPCCASATRASPP